MSTLLEKYNRPAPRYTSYPPAPHWGVAGGDLLIKAIHSSSHPFSIYVHVPFCERLCLYCGCNVIISKDHSVSARYLELLIAEMDLVEQGHGRLVRQIHWGGGTPTYLNTDQIGTLFNAIVTRFAVPCDAEVSIEIDPRVTTSQHLRTLRSLGFNRLSIGVQDFDPEVQAAIHRLQPFELTRDLFAEARGLGFESINVDLIYGLPFQNKYSFGHTLDLIQQLQPDRIAVFSYAHVPAIKKQQKALESYLPSEIEKLVLFSTAVDHLTSAGYEYIGMDHFALPEDPLSVALHNGTLHRNFQGYTNHAETDLLAFGVSAISHIADTFTQNHREIPAYEGCIREGKIPVARGYVLTEEDRLRGTIIEKLLCHGMLSKPEIEDRFSIRFDQYFAPELDRLSQFERDGLVDGVRAGMLHVTRIGRTYIRAIAQVFDAFQPAPVASRAV
jgi:oxygen-independent coproporphyrinogen III oxidase